MRKDKKKTLLQCYGCTDIQTKRYIPKKQNIIVNVNNALAIMKNKYPRWSLKKKGYVLLSFTRAQVTARMMAPFVFRPNVYLYSQQSIKRLL